MNTCRPRVIEKITMLMIAGTLLVGSQSRGQNSSDERPGHLHGTVTDQSGAVIPDAKLFFMAGGSTYSATTRANGGYDTMLPAGRYAVDIKKAGFCYRRAPLLVQASTPLTINAILPVCAIALVVTTGNGVTTERDEPRPTFREESISVPSQSAQGLSLLITFANRRISRWRYVSQHCVARGRHIQQSDHLRSHRAFRPKGSAHSR
jgi:hypothetical protein